MRSLHHSAIGSGSLLAAGLFLVLGTAPAFADGALAVGKCSAWGWSSAGSLTAAREEAVSDCSKSGNGDCRVVATTHGGCVAIAADAGASCSQASWATQATKSDAESDSLSDCRGRDGKSCSVVASKCDRME